MPTLNRYDRQLSTSEEESLFLECVAAWRAIDHRKLRKEKKKKEKKKKKKAHNTNPLVSFSSVFESLSRCMVWLPYYSYVVFRAF